MRVDPASTRLPVTATLLLALATVLRVSAGAGPLEFRTTLLAASLCWSRLRDAPRPAAARRRERRRSLRARLNAGHGRGRQAGAFMRAKGARTPRDMLCDAPAESKLRIDARADPAAICRWGRVQRYGRLDVTSPSHRGAYAVLAVSTLAFMVSFAVWMMFGVIGIPIRRTLGLDNTQFGLLTATPVLLGAVMRLPLGIWTDRFGGRIVMTLLLVIASIPVYLVSYATQYWQLLAVGLLLGIVGASFAVGTPYCARFFPQEKRGFAMGVFGAGTIGAALNMFAAPRLIESYGWQMVPKVYALVLLATGIVFWLVAAPDPGTGKNGGPPLRRQLAVLKDPRVWRLCQYYSLAFGGFTALSLWMTQYYIQEYGFDVKVAGTLAMAFALPAGILRAFGGWLSDRFGAHAVTWWVLWAAWIVLFLISYPPTQMTIKTIDGPASFHLGWTPALLTML
jgi:NNP family nitrate/nitrite transporter-like MFS transporter